MEWVREGPRGCGGRSPEMAVTRWPRSQLQGGLEVWFQRKRARRPVSAPSQRAIILTSSSTSQRRWSCHPPRTAIQAPAEALSRLELQLLSRGLEFLISSLTLAGIPLRQAVHARAARRTRWGQRHRRRGSFSGSLSSAAGAASSDPFGSSFRFYAPEPVR